MSDVFPFEVLRVSGSNYEMGLEIGCSFKSKIVRFVESSQLLKRLRQENAERFENLQELANRYFPQYVEEIKGISEGAGVEYRDLALLNFKYEYLRRGCSTIVFKRGNMIVLGHNEDGAKENEENSFLLIANPLKGTPFLAYCYPGMIPGNAFSFNSQGVVMTGNAMPTPDPRIGVPRHLVDRFMLEAPTINDAVGRALFPRRASGYSYNLASLGERRVINLETTSQRHHITEIEDMFFHTNHYVSPSLGDCVQRIGKSSLLRYRQGVEMVNEAADSSELCVLEILYSTENKPYSIYSSGGSGCSWTLCTAVFEISSDILLRIHARKERNCEPTVFSQRVFEE